MAPQRIILPDSGKAIDFFLLYFSEEIIGNIVEFTNKNAQVKQAQNWRPVMPQELKVFSCCTYYFKRPHCCST